MRLQQRLSVFARVCSIQKWGSSSNSVNSTIHTPNLLRHFIKDDDINFWATNIFNQLSYLRIKCSDVCSSVNCKPFTSGNFSFKINCAKLMCLSFSWYPSDKIFLSFKESWIVCCSQTPVLLWSQVDDVHSASSLIILSGIVCESPSPELMASYCVACSAALSFPGFCLHNSNIFLLWM